MQKLTVQAEGKIKVWTDARPSSLLGLYRLHKSLGCSGNRDECSIHLWDTDNMMCSVTQKFTVSLCCR